MLFRHYHDLSKEWRQKRVLLIFGPRRVGKTTLLKKFLKSTDLKYKLTSGDNIRFQNLLNSNDFDRIKDYVEGYEILAIDEAQQINNIGMGLKIIVDEFPEVKVIASGSSSFHLAQSVGEPLTGRKGTLTLFPIAQLELLEEINKHELKENLEKYLLFGSYPEILVTESKSEKIEILKELVDSYLLKDVLAHEKVKKSETLFNLVKLLAFQIGQLVSYQELATQLHIDIKTVQRYIDLLEKSYVIKKLTGFSQNMRNEITNKHKYYFFDLGIRNAAISHFNDLKNRKDVGQLFENFIFMERFKKNTYSGFYGNQYFWRTYIGNEIDLVEEIDGKLSGFEIKWSTSKKITKPASWKEHYSEASFGVIHPGNYLDFIL